MEQMAALRAEWFAQIAGAIESAQQLAWQLGTRPGGSNEARELYRRLEMARLELDSMRSLGVQLLPAEDSDWLQKLGWSGALVDPHD